MNEVLVQRFKDLCQGRGQPDERDFAAALLELDGAVADLSGRLSAIEARGVPAGAGEERNHGRRRTRRPEEE